MSPQIHVQFPLKHGPLTFQKPTVKIILVSDLEKIELGKGKFVEIGVHKSKLMHG